MYSSAQVGIGTSNPDASSVLEIQSTSKGLLIPKLSKTQRDAINSPAVGLLLYQIDNNPGFYYYTASKIWIRIGEETIITANTASITTNQGVITANTSSITANINDIATNTASINTNTARITTNQNGIDVNTNSITTNQGAITANTASITTNISDIALKANKANPTFTGTITSGSISSTGTISATSFVGDGSGLTGITGISSNKTVLSTITIEASELNNYDVSNISVIFVKPGADWTNIYGLSGGVTGQLIHIYIVNDLTDYCCSGISLIKFDFVGNNGNQKFMLSSSAGVDSQMYTSLIFDGTYWRNSKSSRY